MHIVHRAREILSKPSDNRKQWLDRLFVVHAGFSGLWGSLSFIFPHLIAYLFGEEYHHQLRYNPDAETKVAHVVVRMFGALVLGQSWLVWNARSITDGEIRRAFVQAYFGVFTASTVALLRSHLSDPYWHPVRNPMVILAFAFLALFYGWFALFQKPVVFEGLPKTVQ